MRGGGKTLARRKDDISDPILRAVKPQPEPSKDDLYKPEKEKPKLAAGGSPAARRTGFDQARRQGPLGWLQILGPGLITGASDDDPSGIGTYSQVGSQFGFGLLWTALFTFPLMSAVQELCARIALQTGTGLGTALRRKFPTWIVSIAVIALCVANMINLGADLGAVAAGASLLSVGHVSASVFLLPIAALILALQLFTSYSTIF